MKHSVIILSLILLLSCHRTSEQVEPQSFDFETTIDATFDKVKINEVIKPVDFMATKNYLIVLHDAESGEDQLYVYSLDSLRFLYSFAQKGTGPLETIALDVFRNAGNNDYIDLFDQSNYKRLRYSLTDTGAEPVLSDHPDLPNMGPLQETWWVNDSVIVFSTMNWELITFNVKTDSVIDTFRMSDLFDGIADSSDSHKLCDFQFSLCGDRLAIGLLYVKQLLTGRILNNKIEVDLPNGELIRIPESLDREYYTFVSQSDSLIFAQYIGKPQQFIPKFGPFMPDFTQEIGCFDKDLKPVCKIIPDIQTPRFYIDRKNNRILCWDQTSDFEYIYTFPIPN
ncbi:MAG: TolB-like 6-bladed beta-propeller domain-containing protein [Muribaculaceae bacterium]|nr:TolB-like 6-bladed beta-propeller domain-containing protein [Muribaculaceae bacterium]